VFACHLSAVCLVAHRSRSRRAAIEVAGPQARPGARRQTAAGDSHSTGTLPTTGQPPPPYSIDLDLGSIRRTVAPNALRFTCAAQSAVSGATARYLAEQFRLNYQEARVSPSTCSK
jgi:hypothetical protein